MNSTAFDPAENDAAASCFLAMTTTDTDASAEDLASRIVLGELAACVQIVPVKSVYHWRGQLSRNEEWLLLIKGGAKPFAELEQFIRAHHSYELPEVVRLPITGGSSDYLRYLRDPTRT